MSGTGGFAELTLEGHDLVVIKRFYSEAVGLRVLTRDEDRVWLDGGGNARPGLWSPGEREYGDEGGAHVHFAFRATPGGLEALCAGLRASGTEVRGPEEHPGGDRSISFSDPDPEANVVEAWDFYGRGRAPDALADGSGDPA